MILAFAMEEDYPSKPVYPILRTQQGTHAMHSNRSNKTTFIKPLKTQLLSPIDQYDKAINPHNNKK